MSRAKPVLDLMSLNEDTYLLPDQVLELLDSAVSIQQLYTWLKAGRIDHVRTPGNQYRIKLLDLMKFLTKYPYLVTDVLREFTIEADEEEDPIGECLPEGLECAETSGIHPESWTPEE